MQNMKKETQPLFVSTAVEKNQNSSQLITRDDIDGTPFKVTGSEEQGYYLTMGNYKLSACKPTKDEILQIITDEMWNTIINLVTAILHFDKNHIQSPETGTN